MIFAVCRDGHLWQCEYSFTSSPHSSVAEHKVRPCTSISPSLKVLVQSDHWHLAFLWVLNGGLRGTEASAWFSRVKTKRLLKIPRSSHDPRKDLDPTCVRFPFHGLRHTKSTYLADLFCLLPWILDNELQCFPRLRLKYLAWEFGNNENLYKFGSVVQEDFLFYIIIQHSWSSLTFLSHSRSL